MKNLVLALAVILACSVGAFAGACPQTTYDNYLGSGFNCTVVDQTYSNFNYSGTSNPPGFQIPAGSVAVTPLTSNPGGPGLQFSAGWFASTPSGIQEQDSLFQFQVNDSNTPITDLSLSISGASFTGTGSIVVDETACLGAVLPTCTGGTIITLSVFDNSSGQQLTDTASFAGVSEVSIDKDLTVLSGSNGSASVSVLTDQFSEGTSTVPEPGTLSMLGLGGVALFGFARRKLNL